MTHMNFDNRRINFQGNYNVPNSRNKNNIYSNKDNNVDYQINDSSNIHSKNYIIQKRYQFYEDERSLQYFEENNKKKKRERNPSFYPKNVNKIANQNLSNTVDINKLINSKIGLYNAGGSCYMASIIQILIHSKLFLEEFLKLKNNNRNSLTYLFGNFIKKIANSYFNKIEIFDFAKEYNKINNKFNGQKGNNPMTFFNEFIKKLEEENDEKITKIYSGKKKISFVGMPDSDYEENFIFNLVNLDKERRNIKAALEEVKQLEGDDNIYILEEIIEKPKILIINLEVDKIKYNIEEEIDVGDTKYNLKAINRYTNYHSIA